MSSDSMIWRATCGSGPLTRLLSANLMLRKAGRPPGPPRLPKERAPRIPKDGAIPDDADSMPDEIEYDETKHHLMIGTGFIDNVPAAVWRYEVSGKRVLTQWFSYRKKSRE